MAQAVPKTKLNKNSVNSEKKSLIPQKYHTALWITAIVVSIFIFFWGAISKGGFNTSDNIASESMSTYLHDANNSGEFPQWIPYLFSGMPSYGSLFTTGNRWWDITTKAFISVTQFFGSLFASDVARVIMFYVFYGIGIFLLMRHKKHSKMISFITAMGAVFSTHIITWVMIGHNTKPIVLALLPYVFLLVEKLRHKFSLLNAILLIFAVHLMIEGNHVQMLFYSIIALSLYFVFELINNLNNNRGILKVLRAAGMLILAGGIGFLMSADRYFSAFEYTPHSTRGTAPLKQHTEQHVDKPVRDYAYSTMWSFNPGESFSFLVPGFFGTNPIEYNGTEQPFYFGAKESEDSPPYMGIGFLCLGLVGFILYRKDPFVQSLMAISVVGLIMSFGKNSPGSGAWYIIISVLAGMFLLFNGFRNGKVSKPLFWFFVLLFLIYITGLLGVHKFDMFKLYDMLFWNLPMFYSFRAPSMSLALLQFAIPILAGYGLTGIIKMRGEMTKNQKYLVYGLGAVAALFLISGFLYSGMYQNTYNNYISSKFAPMLNGQQMPTEILSGIWKGMTTDWYFSAFILIIVAGAVYMYANKKLNKNIFLTVILITFIIDLWRIDFRAMHPSENSMAEEVFAPYQQFYESIKQQDKSLYRVADLTAPHENMLAYFRLQSVGGYHPAKLRVYQDLMDLANVDNFAGSTHQLVNPFLWNMMNVKYIITPGQNRQPIIQPNPSVMPRAFFVNNYAVAKPTDIVAHLKTGDFNPRDTVFTEEPLSVSIQPVDSTATAEVKEYKNEYIKIQTSNSGNNFLFISEIYYKPCWKAFVDGKETPIIKSNYAFRGIVVPAGQHTVEMKYHSDKFETGKTLSLSLNIFGILLLAGGIFIERKSKKKDQDADNETSEDKD